MQGVGGGVVVAGQAASQGCADGAGQDGEGDVGVGALRGDGPGERVGVEGPDGFGEALFDVHAAGVPLDDLFDGGVPVVGDDDGRGVATQAGVACQVDGTTWARFLPRSWDDRSPVVALGAAVAAWLSPQ